MLSCYTTKWKIIDSCYLFHKWICSRLLTNDWSVLLARPNCFKSSVSFFRLQLIYAIYLFYDLNNTIKYLIMAHYNLTTFSPIIVNNYFIKRNQDCHVQTLPPIFLFFFESFYHKMCHKNQPSFTLWKFSWPRMVIVIMKQKQESRY